MIRTKTLNEWRREHPDVEVWEPSVGSNCTTIFNTDPELWRLVDFRVSSRSGDVVCLVPYPFE